MLTRIHSPRRSCAAQRRRRPSPRKRFTACRGIGCKAGWSIVARPTCSRWSQLEEVDQRLSFKVCKIVSQVRPEAIQQSGSSAKALRQKTKELLQAGRVYVLDRARKFQPASA